jgi:uncharacterized membrane protein YccF (DUF307 family)
MLNFVLGGFATTLSWLFATHVDRPLTAPAGKSPNSLLRPYGNEAIHVDELNPESKNALMNTGDPAEHSVADFLRLVWFCIMHIFAGASASRLLYSGGDREL